MIIFSYEKEFDSTKYRSSETLDVELALVLTNELPHLPSVAFLQSSHKLETKWN